MKKELIKYLADCITDNRKNLFDEKIENRTNYITVVLEDIYQPQNASAVLRTSDCFGIQNIHIVENENTYRINPDVVLGSDQWLNIYNYNTESNNTLDVIQKLKTEGYRIIATTPHINDVSLDDFDINKGKFALFFGAEVPGLSKTMLDNADEFLKIPMYGFTESFNISVSAAIIIHHLSEKLRISDIDWHLTEEEKDEIMIKWLKQTIKKSEMIVENFYKLKQIKNP